MHAPGPNHILTPNPLARKYPPVKLSPETTNGVHPSFGSQRSLCRGVCRLKITDWPWNRSGLITARDFACAYVLINSFQSVVCDSYAAGSRMLSTLLIRYDVRWMSCRNCSHDDHVLQDTNWLFETMTGLFWIFYVHVIHRHIIESYLLHCLWHAIMQHWYNLRFPLSQTCTLCEYCVHTNPRHSLETRYSQLRVQTPWVWIGIVTGYHMMNSRLVSHLLATYLSPLRQELRHP